jgi:hypothetical protein
MDNAAFAGTVMFWIIGALATAIARDEEVRGEPVGAVAAGILWPIYLPYRLSLIIRSAKP